MKDKLRTVSLKTWLDSFDLIFLSEVKRRVPNDIPGFMCFEARNSNINRGGLILLVKNRLVDDIRSLDDKMEEQLWLELKSFPDVIFGGIYIPPYESLYFKRDFMAYVSGKTADMAKKYVVGGDFNARCGDKVLSLLDADSPVVKYDICDYTTNNNGKELIRICKDNNLLVVNGANTKDYAFESKMTFRRKEKWISDLDKCIASPCLFQHITRFHIDDRFTFPSDHSPLSITLHCDVIPASSCLLQTANALGSHAILKDYI